jgi:ketosteroid isomerase-like protein
MSSTTAPVQPLPAAVSEILAQIKELNSAICAKDVDRIMSMHTDDAVTYDIFANLKNAAELRDLWLKCMPMFPSTPFRLEDRNPVIHTAGDVGYGFWESAFVSDVADNHPMFSGPPMRNTLGFRKIGGVWKIEHAHISAPIKMEGGQCEMNKNKNKEQ